MNCLIQWKTRSFHLTSIFRGHFIQYFEKPIISVTIRWLLASTDTKLNQINKEREMESLDEVCQSFPILYLWLQYKIFDTQKNIKREETKKKSKRLYDKRLYKVENIVTTIKISHTEYDKREKKLFKQTRKTNFLLW